MQTGEEMVIAAWRRGAEAMDDLVSAAGFLGRAMAGMVAIAVRRSVGPRATGSDDPAGGRTIGTQYGTSTAASLRGELLGRG
jgi:hypothetical protein